MLTILRIKWQNRVVIGQRKMIVKSKDPALPFDWRVGTAGQSAIDAGSFDLTIILRWPITAQFCYFMRKMVNTQKLVASLLSDLGFQLNMYCVTKSRERKKWRMILYSCENDRRPVGRGLTVVYHFLRPRLFVTRYTFEHV